MARQPEIRDARLSTAEQIIAEARNGRMFILIDGDGRSNQGELVVPAQMATPDKINFMARYGRGLICLAMTSERVRELGLDDMRVSNGRERGRAFTVSIEAREGVSTGISAADRARTITTAIDASKGRADIVTPGHVFPVTASDGGVLVRAGHAEAAVDVARLAGLNASGVICGIMSADGNVAPLDDLYEFAVEHDLRIGTIRDIIAYRRRNDHLVERREEARFTSAWGGEWNAISYSCSHSPGEMIALVKGSPDPDKPALVRMHVTDVFADGLAVPGERSGLLENAMRAIADNESGVIVLLRREANISDLIGERSLSAAEDQGELRDYGIGAQILADLGVHDMVLLTNSRVAPSALKGFGLNIVEQRPLYGQHGMEMGLALVG
ncbi:3,4-dihydroxy-2-butanone-4-phosphate synthase [Sphingopyxis sp.]|uniref:3,4-dihydroxy-2-butanone-4-phosphate synthase n=1 Tax=Sphingopyxis sp. TaxID=1908224 RepID=UPI002DE26EB7|nr:3,4-dihydroxy-2-butanone-4-phosphate synthase [Sphingopyxis sp.]